MGLIVVANREPLREENGSYVVSVGGLVTALLPVLERRGGAWVAWGEKNAKELPRIGYPPESPRFTVERIFLSEHEVTNYYHGLANRVLWPVAHYFIDRMEHRRGYFEVYAQVNRRFAETTLGVWGKGDLVWVQDYQLMLVPMYLRMARPAGRIGYFWHIPWPALEVWRVLPKARELIRGLLGADLIGFHTGEYVDNFLEAARVLLGARVHRHSLDWEGRTVRVETHPIGIDTQRFHHLAFSPTTGREAQRIRQAVDAPLLILGVDRLDYTKGIPERLLAYERFLQSNPAYRGRVNFIQIATPSRTSVESYRQLKRLVDETSGRINGSFSRSGWLPLRYLYRTFSTEQLAAYYRAADAMIVTPLRDGMNLVAQEFVAVSEGGGLMLSELAGAARMLPEALTVNPYDLEGMAQGLHRILRWSREERRSRLAALKERVTALDVHIWAEGFLASLEGSGS